MDLAAAKQAKGWSASPFWSSALFGGIFGVFFTAVWAWLRPDDGLQVWFFVFAPVLTGLVSGVSGAVSGYIDEALARRGLESEWQRRSLSFAVVASLVLTLFVLGGQRFFDSSTMLPAMAWGGPLVGVLFGAAVAIVDYRSWLLRSKMELLEKENRYLAEIAQRDEALQEVSRSLILTEERSRMAQELHDSISQGLHGLGYGLQALQSRVDQGKPVEDVIKHLQTTLESTQKELRAVIEELQPSAVQEQGLAAAFAQYGQWFGQRYPAHSLVIDVQYMGGLLPAQEAAAYRILQEALTNVGRHAGSCQVRVCLAADQGAIVLAVVDTGCGIKSNDAATGRGLRNMEDRVHQTGGQWHLATDAGKGTTIEARWPQRDGTEGAVPWKSDT